MNNYRWLNRSQPPYLQNATILFYMNAAFALIFFGSGDPFGLLKLIGIGAGFGIANEKKWGYFLGLVVAIIPFLTTISWIVLGHGNLNYFDLAISFLFQGLLVVFLVHPMSRNYQKIWFK